MFLTVQYIPGLNSGVSTSNKGNWQNPDNVHLDELVGFSRKLSNTEMKTSSVILDLRNKEIYKDRNSTFEGDYDKAYNHFYSHYPDQLDKINEFLKAMDSVGSLSSAIKSKENTVIDLATSNPEPVLVTGGSNIIHN